MVAEEQREKKTGLGRKIGRGFGVSIIVILIILGVVFQAPWQVVAFFFLCLLSRFTSKRINKYIGYTIIGVVIVSVIWVFLPDDDITNWQPFTFDDELEALEAKYEVPDNQNAATIYNKLLETYDREDFRIQFKDEELANLAITEHWTSEDEPELAKWIEEKHDGTIESLMQISRKERCSFSITPSLFSETEQEDKRRGSMKEWAKLLVMSGNNDIGEGRTDLGLEKYEAALGIGKHERQQPAIIDYLAGIGIEAIVSNQFNRLVIIGDITESHLNIIEGLVTSIKHDWASDWIKVIEHEKLVAKNSLCCFVYEKNSEGRVRRAPNFNGRPKEGDFSEKRKRKFTRLVMSIGVPNNPRSCGDYIDDYFQRFYAMAEPDYDWDKEPEEFSYWPIMLNYKMIIRISLDMLEPAFHKIHDFHLRVISNNRAGRVLIALRRYKNENGYWPESLDDIRSQVQGELFIDPVNGNSYVYKIADDGFTLYSKGKNNIDEGGDKRTKKSDGTETDDMLIWPSELPKSKEDETDGE